MELPEHYSFATYLVHFLTWNSICLFVVVIYNICQTFSYQPSYVLLCSGLSDLHETVKRISSFLPYLYCVSVSLHCNLIYSPEVHTFLMTEFCMRGLNCFSYIRRVYLF